MDILTLLALALAPGATIGLYIYIKDKHEREPLGLLVKAFFCGILSVLLTLLTSFPINAVIPIEPHSLSQQAVHAFLLVALIEEFSKFVFVRWIFYRDENFNEPFDGIVYAVSVSLGFAGLENILYISDGGLEVALLRMFTAVPAHATFAILMGYYLGKAKFEKQHEIRYMLMGLGAAVFFHGAYDYFWFISWLPGIWVGGVASLVVGIIFSRRAIRLHQEASPFKVQQPTDSPENTAS